MMKPRLIPAKLCSFLGVSLLLVSCGKKAETTKNHQERKDEPVVTDFERFLQKQEVVCDDQGKVCPSYISKIVVKTRDTVKFCTGFLLDRETVVTSASCLSSIIRLAGQDCSKDVFFFFPKTYNRPQERASCDKVIQVSSVEGSDPVLWRDNLTFLKLKDKVSYRGRRLIRRDGLLEDTKYYMWGIEQVDDKTAFIRRQTCTAVHNSYVNPLASEESSPTMLMGGCQFKKGSSGAPLLDRYGRVQGVVSENIDKEIRNYLENSKLVIGEKLAPLFHATNFACAPTPENSHVKDEAECSKDLNYKSIDELRTEMMRIKDELFTDLKEDIEKKISATSEYFNYGIRFLPRGEARKVEFFPRCFKEVSTWINSLNTNRNSYVFDVKLPELSLKRGLDLVGRVKGYEETEGESGYKMQFSPKSLKHTARSTVFMWNDSSDHTFYNVSENCL